MGFLSVIRRRIGPAERPEFGPGGRKLQGSSFCFGNTQSYLTILLHFRFITYVTYTYTFSFYNLDQNNILYIFQVFCFHN